ncbi:hypothetical protein PoB_005067500 [Plakobranchus ocellatus]|uniref:Uncharacterized protein n=1 Tax=Plakobranchus ocellatus TaxID=259542 RepID=A0AAV4BXX2_9GAST|nr:hypothetical protein PoB_005067500 [Plakobranchus ocellatus]
MRRTLFQNPNPKMKTFTTPQQSEIRMLVLRYVKRGMIRDCSRGMIESPATPHQRTHSPRTPKPVLPYQQPGTKSSTTRFVTPHHTMVPSPDLTLPMCCGSSTGSITSVGYDNE